MPFPELTDRICRLLRINRRNEPATTIDVDRELTPKERELVEWLLLHGDPSAVQFLAQLEGIRVHGRCSCGCPSIDLSVCRQCPPAASETNLLADFVGMVHGAPVGVILHQRGGRLVELEVYALGESPKPFDLPDHSSLRPFDASQPNVDPDPNECI
jgi:hypothetical protein